MRAQHARDDRANGAANPKQEQDPIERRRLQNRLSQRNHRRKIRDRIAKLQERVIASELRAAASLNGWNYHHPTAPLVTPTPAYDVERKVLSPAVEVMPAMSGTYLPGSTGTYYPFSTLSPAPPLPPQPSPTFPQYEPTAKEVDSSGSSSPCAPTNSSVCSPGASSFNLDMAPNASNNYVPSEMNGQYQTEPWNIYTQNSQSNFYYMTTGSRQRKYEAKGSHSAPTRRSASRSSATVYISTSLTNGTSSTSYKRLSHTGLDMSVPQPKLPDRVSCGLDARDSLYKSLSLARFIATGWLSTEAAMKQPSARNGDLS
ncbi:hypothetical protein ABOM_003537 [Aspergillus bombycis]|uniref:BZIP domain-containing protein n=1 Tax=Aspergillus bombycis TaxID=109264 RepID=A0A1F8ACL8_9EURO|nr:hypothetical protein ABOM_003537 [Aspergillus bombycis]OGM49443.1 hypothetical protein ABOM_003537 [Aspergillus bombycis]